MTVKYSLLKDSEQLFTSKYQLYLPTKEELIEQIVREKDHIEQEKRLNE